LSKRGIIRRKTARSAPFRREFPFIMPPSRARAASLLFGTVLVCATTWAQVRLRENREEEKNNGDVSVGPRSHWKVPKDTFVFARCAENASIPLTSAEMGNAARNAACDLFFGSIRMWHANMRRRTRRKKRRRRRRCRLFQRASSPPMAALERCKRHALSPSGCRKTCRRSAPLCCRIYRSEIAKLWWIEKQPHAAGRRGRCSMLFAGFLQSDWHALVHVRKGAPASFPSFFPVVSIFSVSLTHFLSDLLLSPFAVHLLLFSVFDFRNKNSSTSSQGHRPDSPAHHLHCREQELPVAAPLVGAPEQEHDAGRPRPSRRRRRQLVRPAP
jgi:hypothetical protein